MNAFDERGPANAVPPRPKSIVLSISLKVPKDADVGQIIKAASDLGDELISISLGPNYGYDY